MHEALPGLGGVRRMVLLLWGFRGLCGLVPLSFVILIDLASVTSISQINFFLSLVNAKRELFSPLVIVGSQIFERPSDGRYGGRWISDEYLKSNIW